MNFGSEHRYESLKMKAYELQDTSRLAGMKLVDKPVPQPDAGQVLVSARR
jgi:NADPH:quinone reductase-like Zn-dependent oxidoreductase